MAGKAAPSPAIPRAPSGSTEASDDLPSTTNSLKCLAQPQISVQELMKLLDGAENECQVIDVREPLEFRQSHILGAINKGRELFIDQLHCIVDDFAEAGKKTIVIYCHSGQRASPCAAKLAQHIQDHHAALNIEVKVLTGGFAAWIKHCNGNWLSKGLSGLATDLRKGVGMDAASQEKDRYVERAPCAAVTVSSKSAIMQENSKPLGRGRWRCCGRTLQCGSTGHRFY
jgi:rhodanese-related sulfurtransferase